MTIKIYKPEQISDLKEIWKFMECGVDMTYFQTYHWYKMLAEVGAPREKWMDTIVAVIYREENPVMIAPLIIVKATHYLVNKKGVYIWGRRGWSDYLNMIYIHFDKDAFKLLTTYIKDNFGINRYEFEQIRSDSEFYQFLISRSDIEVARETLCVNLMLPPRVDDYEKLLSKHQRQNIRTARNRLKKDGVELSICFDDKDVDKDLCKEMRASRVAAKQEIVFFNKSFPRRIASILKHRLEYRYPSYLPFYEDYESKLLTIYDGDTLCAFFNYGIDELHKTVVLMAVGTNDDYARYSPGMLGLYSFIRNMIEKNNIKCLDFTRGDEPYKFAMGGANS